MINFTIIDDSTTKLEITINAPLSLILEALPSITIQMGNVDKTPEDFIVDNLKKRLKTAYRRYLEEQASISLLNETFAKESLLRAKELELKTIINNNPLLQDNL